MPTPDLLPTLEALATCTARRIALCPYPRDLPSLRGLPQPIYIALPAAIAICLLVGAVVLFGGLMAVNKNTPNNNGSDRGINRVNGIGGQIMSLLHSFVDGVFDFAGMNTALDEMLAAQATLPAAEFAGKVASMSGPMRYLALAAVRAEIDGNSHTPEEREKLARLESALATA